MPSMHRILLYALVIGLVYLSWSSRPGATHAALSVKPAAAQPNVLNEGGDSTSLTDSGNLARASHGAELLRRMEERVEPLGASWHGLTPGAATEVGPELPGDSLAEWLGLGRPRAGSEALAVLTALDDGPATDSGDESGAAHADTSEEREPFYVVSLARVESLTTNLPPWSGLLDLALDPAAVREGLRTAGADSRGPFSETAWLSDDQGVLLARVAALDGLGLMLDPSWPWMPRARRLMLSPVGSSGFSARQYRIVLYGSAPGRTWSGRLVLIAMPASRGPGSGH